MILLYQFHQCDEDGGVHSIIEAAAVYSTPLLVPEDGGIHSSPLINPESEVEVVTICGWRVTKPDLGQILAPNISLVLAWLFFIYL